MKNKGFTLTEILAVIVIIGLLLLIVAPNLLNKINPKEKEITELQKKMLEEAAGFYADNHSECANGCDTDTDTLIEEGYLNADFKDVKENRYINKTIIIDSDGEIHVS